MSQTTAQLISGTSAQSPTFGATTVTSLNGGPIAGTRNRIINGAMQVWQRATSFSNVGSIYTVDRFASSITGGNVTVTQDTSAPTVQFRYSLKLAPATNATYAECVMRQFIEQQNIDDFLGNTITGSAWVKCSKSTVKMRLTSFNVTGGGDQSITFSVTPNTWTKISYTYTTAFGSATAWTSTANQAGAFLDIGFVDNTALTTADSLFITGVQLEPGTVATPFERRSYGAELALCQRYFYKTDKNFTLQGYGASAGVNNYADLTHPVTMRASPTASAAFSAGVNNQSQTITPSAQSFTIQLISNATGDFAINYVIGNTFSAEL